MSTIKEVEIHKTKPGSDGDAAAKKFTVFVGKAGADVEEIEVDAGTKVRDIIEYKGWEKSKEIRHNREDADLDAELKEGDMVVVVPEAVQGG